MAKFHIYFLLGLSLVAGCRQSAANKEPEGFEIAGHDIASGRYTILERMHATSDRYVIAKIIAVCKSYRSGTQPPLIGSDVCDLPVGRIYRTNLFDQDRPKGDENMIVNFLPNQSGLSILERAGKDQTSSYLAIESINIASDGPAS